MTERTAANGTFRFDSDTKRYHRFQVEGEGGIVGSVFIPKGGVIPGRITLLTWQPASAKSHVLRMLDEGVSQKDIAVALGITAGRVSQIRAEGIMSAKGKLRDES
ncbi:MAG: hypothetical protein WCJ37_03385 [Syntrophus sp. (in: bacteria)]